MSLILYMLMLAKLAAVVAYKIDLKIVNLPCQTTQCRSMKICYSYDRFCNTGSLPRYCLEGLYTNKYDINTETAMKGESSFYEYKKEIHLGDSPKVLSVILNDQGKVDVYCEDILSRNESGSAMFVHLDSMTSFSSPIDIELTSDCDENCTGVVCNRCYNHPPVVTISVQEPVIIDDNVTIVCRILPLTKDTQILWLMSNGTSSKTIHTSDKYQVSTSKTLNSSILTIYSVHHEDELNYSCQAINFMQTRRSKEVSFNATVLSTDNITSTDHNLTTQESVRNSQLPSTTHSTKEMFTMKIVTTPSITPANQLRSTKPKRTSSTIPIRTTLKLSSTSKYITISSSAKGASTATSGTSPTTKSSTILTNIKSVNTTITTYSIVQSSVTILGRNTSSAVSSTRYSATTSPTINAISSTDPKITKTPTASLGDKDSSSSFEAIRSKEEAYFQKLLIIATCAIVGLELVIIVLLIWLVRRQKRWRLEKKTDKADTKF